MTVLMIRRRSEIASTLLVVVVVAMMMIALAARQVSGLLPLATFRSNARAFRTATTTTIARSPLVPLLERSRTTSNALWTRYASSSSSTNSAELTEEQRIELEQKIKQKGDEIRVLKEGGADKKVVAPLVEELLALKAQLDPSAAVVDKSTKKGFQKSKQEPKRKQQQKKKQQQQQQVTLETQQQVTLETQQQVTLETQQPQTLEKQQEQTVEQQQQQPLEKKQQKAVEKKEPAESEEESESDFITARAVDYSKWYNDLIRVTGLAENSPVRGCMVIKPWGMSIWDRIRTELDAKIQQHGAENAYFPLLIPKSFLSKEAEHVDGFATECAVVTHHRLTTDPNGSGELIADPDAELDDPLIIRPTSETMIWYMFRKWIKSHRDLPLKINQWANVMRWEMRTRPFLRTSEFLWQEGHTAHATPESAVADARGMLENYAKLCENLLAMPVIKGVKSPSERFAGASDTYTIEALMQNGWALQSGTSHFLGQSFGKAFDVTFQDQNGEQHIVWGTSWGVSTRLLGALIMTHSDDAGLVLPPRVAPIQVVIVSVPPRKNALPEAKQQLDDAVQALAERLRQKNIRVKVDDRDYVYIGAKFFEWERKGVPLRIEIGPRDVENQVCVFKYRAGVDEKLTMPLAKAADAAALGLEQLQKDLFQAAIDRLERGIRVGATYDEMKTLLENDEASEYNGPGLFMVPWKCNAENEKKIKEECKATIRCYPLAENNAGMYKGKKCFYSGDDATHMALFGRAF